ncbi:MAG: hypothetical protein FJX46_16840 [Alphaproteobacteria bacterium]|nr:hypothetical protein [Alphaproteobacteria bacterium]
MSDPGLKYWEDVAVGDRREGGPSAPLTEDAIVAFARKFDPQYFHLDPAAAKDSLFGGLVASGWHTAAICMQLIVEHFIKRQRAASLGSPGFDQLRWQKPVRPGDALSVRSVCIETAPSKSRPDLGSARFRTEVLNQHGETVMSLISIGLYRRRPRGNQAMATTLTLTAADGHSFSAYRADPAGPAKGAVVVIQEIFGVNAHIREVCDGFARDGYVAIAPALFDRVERGVEIGYSPEDIARGRGIREKVTFEMALADVAAAGAAVGGLAKCGVVGYCWGGSVAWLAATRLKPACAVGYYGGNTLQFQDEKQNCPVLLHYGEKDAGIPIDQVRAFKAKRTDVTMEIYPADHGFNCDHRKQFDNAASKLARERTLAFFGQHLRP